MRTIEDMIRQEVICNVSALVSTLAEGYGAAVDTGRHGTLQPTIDQAYELSCPIQDWESAAIEAIESFPGRFIDADKALADYAAFCGLHDIEPHEREILEHWFVTKWLAEALEAKGERIDTDFAGHCVWGRTTSGQGIACDSVIMEVYADAKRRYEEAFPCS